MTRKAPKRYIDHTTATGTLVYRWSQSEPREKVYGRVMGFTHGGTVVQVKYEDMNSWVSAPISFKSWIIEEIS